MIYNFLSKVRDSQTMQRHIMKIKAEVEVQWIAIFSTNLICRLIRPVCCKEKSHANQNSKAQACLTTPCLNQSAKKTQQIHMI